MLLHKPEFHHKFLRQQLSSYMAEVDIEAVDRDIFAAVGVCHCFFRHLIRGLHAAEASRCLGSADICSFIQVCLEPTRADGGSSDAAVLKFHIQRPRIIAHERFRRTVQILIWKRLESGLRSYVDDMASAWHMGNTNKSHCHDAADI